MYAGLLCRVSFAPVISTAVVFGGDPAAKKAQHKDAVEPAKPTPQAKKKARTKRNEADEQVMSVASLMRELEELGRLVVVPKISTDPSNEAVMRRQSVLRNSGYSNFWASSLCRHLVHEIEAKFPNNPCWGPSIYSQNLPNYWRIIVSWGNSKGGSSVRGASTEKLASKLVP